MGACPSRRIASLLFAAGVLASSPAQAYRPFDGTDADVAPEGEYELELGPVGWVDENGQNFAVTPWIVNNYGIARGHELVLEGRHFLRIGNDQEIPRSRVVDTDILLKSIIRRGSLQEGKGLSIATEIGPLLPQIHDDDRWGFSVGTIASQRWESLTLHLNVVNAIERTQRYDVFVGMIAEGPDAWAVRPVAEVFVEQGFVPGNEPALTRSALVGAIWRADESFDVDLGVRAARGEEGSVLELRLGITWGIEVVHHEEPPRIEGQEP